MNEEYSPFQNFDDTSSFYGRPCKMMKCIPTIRENVFEIQATKLDLIAPQSYRIKIDIEYAFNLCTVHGQRIALVRDHFL